LMAHAVRKFGHSRAVDFVGATWVGAVESFHRYDPSKGKPLTWLVWRLRGIAANYRDKHMAFDDERGRWREIAAPADDDLDPATVVDFDYFAQWAEAYRARTKGEVAILTTADRATKDKRYRLRRKVRREARQDRPSPL